MFEEPGNQEADIPPSFQTKTLKLITSSNKLRVQEFRVVTVCTVQLLSD